MPDDLLNGGGAVGDPGITKTNEGSYIELEQSLQQWEE